NYLPGGESTNHQLLNTIGLVAVIIGFLIWIVPWSRWDPKATLVLVPFALALIVVSDRYGGMSTYTYGVYFVVVFTWVGIAQPRWTSIWLVPLAETAYLLPFALGRPMPATVVSSSIVTMCVGVLVAETVA